MKKVPAANCISIPSRFPMSENSKGERRKNESNFVLLKSCLFSIFLGLEEFFFPTSTCFPLRFLPCFLHEWLSTSSKRVYHYLEYIPSLRLLCCMCNCLVFFSY